MAYKVIAPLVLVKVPDAVGDGYRLDYHYENSVIPWLSEEQEKHFLDEGMVEKVANSDVAPELRKPAKTASEDKWREYAQQVHGVSHEDAQKLSKQDLVDLYGG